MTNEAQNSPSPVLSNSQASPSEPSVRISAANGFTAEQLQLMSADLVASGALSEQDAAEAYIQSLVDEGVYTEEQAAEARKSGVQMNTAGGAASLNPAVRDWLTEQGVRPASRISEYQMPFHPAEPYDVETDRYARGYFLMAGFSASNGSYLAQEMDKVERAHERMSPAQREIYKREQDSIIKRLLGPNAEERLNTARDLIEALEERQPGLKAYLDKGPGNCAGVILQWVHQAELLARRPQ